MNVFAPHEALQLAESDALDDAMADEQFIYHSDGAALLKGKGSYIADLKLPGMLEIAFLRSPTARARIRHISTEAAAAYDGVEYIATGSDIQRSGIKTLPRASKVLHASELAPEAYNLPSYPLLPVDAVHFDGEVVAAVVAKSRYLAEDAADMIDIEYEDQRAVLDPEMALAPGCEQLFDDVAGNMALEGHYGSKEGPGSLFEDAALVLRRRYRMNRSGNPPLEALGVVAKYENRRLTVWSTIQRPQMLRIALADILDVPMSRVQVIAPQNIGGGFGWKSPMHRETAVVAWLAMQLGGRPVRWIEDRTEALKKGIHARDQIWDMVAAFDANGKILGIKNEVIADVGTALVDMFAVRAARSSCQVPSPYDIPWIQTHLRCAVTNKAPVGYNRPAGRMPAVWAMERLMDDAARKLNLSPLQIRLANLVKTFPYPSPLGGHRSMLNHSDYFGTVDKLLTEFRLEERQQEVKRLRASGRRVGIGLATCVETCRPLCSIGGVVGYNQPQYASVTMRMYPDGSVSIMTGDAPQGQMRHSTMARVTAKELGADINMIEVYTGDTLLSPITNSNTDVTSVCAIAARRLRSKVIGVASHLMKVPAEESNFRCAKGTVTHLPDGKVMSLRDIAWAAMMRPFMLPEGSVPDLAETAYFEPPYAPTSFAAHAAVVEVDAELGKIRVLAYGIVGDCGKVLNPRGLRTGIISGIATGISNLTHEAYIYNDEGQLITANLKDYAMLTAGEMPQEIVIGHHDTPTDVTVYGHKRMITEGVPAGVAPAIANAIVDAFDGAVDLTVIPIFPGDIWGTTAPATGKAQS